MLIEKLSKLSIIQRMYLLTSIFIILLLLIISIRIKSEFINEQKEIKAAEIYNIAAFLEKELDGSFEDFLVKSNTDAKSDAEKVNVLNSELQPIINKLSVLFPYMGIGYYSIELDSILAIGPDFNPSLLQKVPRTYPYFKSYESGKPEYAESGTSIGWYGKSIYNITYPISRDGKIIGHTWANVKLNDIYAQAEKQVKRVFFYGIIALISILLIMKYLFDRFRKQIEITVEKIINDNNIPNHLIPELNILPEKLTEHKRKISAQEKEIKELSSTIIACWESLNEGFLAVDSESRITYVNQKTIELLNCSKDDLVNTNLSDLCKSSPQIISKVSEAKELQCAVYLEEYSHYMNRWIGLDIYPLKDKGVLIYFRDISENIKLKEEVKLSHEKFMKYFYYSPDILILSDIETGRFIDINEAFLKTFGYSREEVMGRTLLELLYKPSDKERLLKIFSDKDAVENEEVDVQTKFGESVKLLVSVDIIEIRGTNYLFSSCKDITQIKKIEEKILNLDKLSIVGEMAATIAHEIRNPLTTIRGFLQLKKMKSTNKNDTEQFDLMIEELDRANEIITEYLSLANNTKSIQQTGNINNIIKAIFPLIQSDAIKENKTAVLNLGDTPDFLLNSREIRQLIFNLVRNGLEAMQECGSLLTISTYTQGNEVVLAVIDEGSGIKSEILNKIGIPFLTTKSKGNGLGLSVCYRIAANHNATIDIDTSSKGTTFFVKFKL
ncbi:MAG: PAS domain S-box protein [Bacillota bacterium]